MWQYNYTDELYHYGVLGMKWGRRKARTTLSINKSDSSVTKTVKNDYNRMNDTEFKNKYQVSKKRYSKRVDKYGDPYTNSPKAQKAKNKEAKRIQKADKKWEKNAVNSDTYVKVYNNAANKLNSKIDSFNKDKKWNKVNLDDPKMKKYNEAYVKAYGKLWDDMLNQSVKEVIGNNPSGTKRVVSRTSEPGAMPTLTIEEIKKKK